jgi:hypothetical protein
MDWVAPNLSGGFPKRLCDCAPTRPGDLSRGSLWLKDPDREQDREQLEQMARNSSGSRCGSGRDAAIAAADWS